MKRLPASLFASAGLILGLAGCGYDPYPTPNPVARPPSDSPLTSEVQQATYETSLITETSPPVVRVERPVQPIIKPFEEWTEQEAAADALGRIGEQAIPYLRQALRSPDPETRKQAAEVLARMGSDASPAVNDLVALLDDPDPEVRKVAVRTLGRIGPEAAAAVPALMRTLLEQEPAPPPVDPAVNPPAVPQPPRLLPQN